MREDLQNDPRNMTLAQARFNREETQENRTALEPKDDSRPRRRKKNSRKKKPRRRSSERRKAKTTKTTTTKKPPRKKTTTTKRKRHRRERNRSRRIFNSQKTTEKTSRRENPGVSRSFGKIRRPCGKNLDDEIKIRNRRQESIGAIQARRREYSRELDVLRNRSA